MFWTATEIKEKLIEAKYFEVIKNYKLNIIFETDKEIKEIVELINEEYPFLKINIIDVNKITIINEGAKEEGKEIEKEISLLLNNQLNQKEEPQENLFSKLMEELIESELMEEIENLLIKKKYNIDKIFDNFINTNLENWQLDIMKEIKNYLNKNNVKNEKIDKILKESLKEDNQKILKKKEQNKEKVKNNKKEKLNKDENNLYIFKKLYQD